MARSMLRIHEHTELKTRMIVHGKSLSEATASHAQVHYTFQGLAAASIPVPGSAVRD